MSTGSTGSLACRVAEHWNCGAGNAEQGARDVQGALQLIVVMVEGVCGGQGEHAAAVHVLLHLLQAGGAGLMVCVVYVWCVCVVCVCGVCLCMMMECVCVCVCMTGPLADLQG